MTRFLAVALASALAVVPASAAPTAQSRYTDALLRERAVRASLAAPDATAAVVREIRAVVKAYELVVKRFPTSGYADNALWQAGRLELDAFERFHDAQDRDAGVRLLRQLARAYDKSKLAKQVPEQLARFEEAPVPSPAPVPVATTANDVKPVRNASLAAIRDIRRTVLPDAVRVTIEFDGEVSFHDEKIADPSRVFVDIPATRATPGFIDRTMRFESDADIVRQIRIGRHPNNTTRVVLDAGGVGTYSVYPLYDPFRLVIDCVREQTALRGPERAAPPETRSLRGPERAAPQETRSVRGAAPTSISESKPRPAAPPLPAAPSTPPVASVLLPLSSHPLPLAPSVRRAPSTSPRAKTLIAQARADAEAAEAAPPPRVADAGPVAPLPSVTAPTPAAPPVPNANGGFSIARQLGLGVSRIVIDAGHGGHDPGAQGRGVTEAELVLDIALRVEKLLEKVSGVEVILTRRTDEFIALQERTAIANRVGADLFLSIHANASPNPAARGIETYFLNFANNLSAAAVAARENAASGQAMGALPDLVKAIALNNKLDESKDFATQVQHTMVERLRGPNRVIKDLGVKQAPFVVLIGAAMPSVLAEISFVTNAQEARLLKSDAYRDRIAEALFNAIRKYQTSLKNGSTVASQ